MFIKGKFKVNKKMCDTCIYSNKSASNFNIKELEDEVKDNRGFLTGFRICHCKKVCCKSFWERNKHDFQIGQIATRLNIVEFV